MKIWSSYGSEHSMNLVMIGHFKEVRDAERAKELIDQFTAHVQTEFDDVGSRKAPADDRFRDSTMRLLMDAKIYDIAPAELEQLAYEASVEVTGERLIITTEESDISAFLKILIDRGARVEVYSAHDYPGTGHGR